ncbi:hypothetical protein HK102_012195, partial [Quaeritorhiza haematococci]
WWGVFLAFGLAAIFVLPVGIIQATSNQQIGLNVLTELVIGFILPGQPLANVTFKTFGYMTMSQALSFLQDLKLAHYMKIPPRAMFICQIYGTILGCTVNYLVFDLLLRTVPDIWVSAQGEVAANQQWNPILSKIFYTASLIWGAIGPERMFGPESIYFPLLWGFVIGGVLPVVFWALDKKWPKMGFKYINWPIILVSIGFTAQNGANTLLSSLIISLLSQYFLRIYHRRFYEKYNYTISAAADTGTVFAAIFVYMLFTLPG